MGLGLNYERTIQIGEHFFTRPDAPKDKRDVLFVDKSREDAYWIRPTDYKDIWLQYIPWHTRLFEDKTWYDDNDGSLITLNQEDSEYILRIYEREMNRRRNGCFFRNGQDLEWLSGNHYFSLAHCKMLGLKGDYGKFLKFQRDHLYLKEKVWADPNILGQYTSKPKKTGITQIEACYYVNKSTMTMGQQMGVMSVSQDVAETVNMTLYYHAFDGLPNPFKPRIKLRSKDSITFGDKPFTGRGQASIAKLAAYGTDSALNTRVFAVPTKERAFDAPLINDASMDEFPKYDTESKQSPKTVFDNNQEAVKQGTIFNGRLWLFSYPPEKDTDGYTEARTIYFASKSKTQNERGRTKTGLICYHISSLYSQWESFDKYGNCDSKKAFYLNDMERKAVKDDPKAYQSKIRQYAIDEAEAWGSGGAGSVFDAARIIELQSALEDERAMNPFPDYTGGKYVWDNPLWEAGKKNKRPPGEFCKVSFLPLTKEEMESAAIGRVREYESTPSHLQNLALTHGRDDWGNLLGPERYTKIGSIDPTDYAAGDEVIQGSKNASFTMVMPNEAWDTHAGKIVTKIIKTEYLWRAINPTETYEDLVKEVIYHDKLVLIEANKAWVATKMIEEGLGRHLLVRDNKTGLLAIWEPNMDYSLIRMEVNSKANQYLEDMVHLITDYIAQGSDGDDYGPTIKSERLLDQLSRFKTDKTKIFDLVMAFGWLLICCETYLAILLRPKDDGYGIDDYAAALRALMAAN